VTCTVKNDRVIGFYNEWNRAALRWVPGCCSTRPAAWGPHGW